MKQLFTLFTLLLTIGLSAQDAPDFTFTDTNGEEHILSETLAEGKVVLLDFFFVSCPPCQDLAPHVDQLVADFEGTTLEVWAISDRDSDAAIEASVFASTHSNHFVGGPAGGGDDIVNMFIDDPNFVFSGFPTYAVICNDQTITWDVWPVTAGLPELRSQLTEDCGVMDLQTSSTADITTLGTAQLAPNPTTGSTLLNFSLTERTNLSVDVINLLGQTVQTQPEANFAAGAHQLQFDLDGFAAGTYTVRLQSADGVRTLPLIVR